MFGHAAKPSKIYTYGGREPVQGVEVVLEQILLGHRYRNALVELERNRRDRVARALAAHCPELTQLETDLAAANAGLDQLETDIKKRNAEARARTGTPEDRRRVAEFRRRKSELWRRHRELRTATYALPAFVADQEVIQSQVVAEGKRLRAASGLHWGSYLAVEQGLQGARRGPPPKFRRFDGSGRVAVQLQRGLDWADARLGRDSRVRVELEPQRGRKVFARVWLRVGSDGRKPVWAVVPVVLHREPPPGTQIKWAYLVRQRLGTHFRWRVQFVLSREDGWPIVDASADGAVGVEVGWRRVGGGLRVAVWRGSDGGGGELVVADKDLARWTRADELRSARDTDFNVARDRLAGWLAAHAAPEWLTEATAHLARWRSCARLASVAVRWRAARFEGDDEAFPPLEAWRAGDKRLLEEEANGRDKAIAWRDDLYRRFAASTRRRYRVVAVEEIDWSALARKTGPEEARDVQAAAKHWRRVAAVGRLCQLVRESAAVVVGADPAGTTVDCHACRHTNRRVDFTQRVHVCEGCGESWDVDENAALWLLDAAMSGEAVV